MAQLKSIVYKLKDILEEYEQSNSELDGSDEQQCRDESFFLERIRCTAPAFLPRDIFSL